MTQPFPRPDIVVLGGGLFGSALTYHLARHRSASVLTVDAGPTRGKVGATGCSAGILSFQGWNRWDLGVLRESAEEYRTVSERGGRGRYYENGGIRVARTEEGERWLGRVLAVLQDDSVEASWVGRDRTEELLPAGNFDGVRACLYTPEDAVFSPTEMASAYARLAVREGAEFRHGVVLTELVWTGERWRLTSADGVMETPRLVLACGAWTKHFLERLGCPRPLSPFRTQACLLRPHPLASSFPTLHDLDLNLYVRPGTFGRILAGDGTEKTEADPDRIDLAADAPFLQKMITDLSQLFPDWGPPHLEVGWAGACVASPDRYPLVGQVPGVSGLFLASGFNGFGTMRRPASRVGSPMGSCGTSGIPLDPPTRGDSPLLDRRSTHGRSSPWKRKQPLGHLGSRPWPPRSIGPHRCRPLMPP